MDNHDQTKEQESWEEIFKRVFVITPYQGYEELNSRVAARTLRGFIKEQLNLAHLSGIRIGEAYKGEAKMKAYQEGYEEGVRAGAERMKEECVEAVSRVNRAENSTRQELEEVVRAVENPFTK